MTRKDYVAIAAELALVRPVFNVTGATDAETAWCDCVRAVGNAFEADNPNFDRPRFVKACLT